MAELQDVEVGVDSKLEELKNWLKTEGYEKYKEARNLSEEESKNDPETEPFKSKYASREILLDLKGKIEAFESEENCSGNLSTILSALLSYQLGMNYAETQETGEGEIYFRRCLDLITAEDDDIDVKSVSLRLQCLNQLGILWSQRSDADKALEYLQSAEALYYRFRKDCGGTPYSMHELFSPDESSLTDSAREKEFEASFTHSLYYLAQVHGALGNPVKSGIYCNTTLQRQLETAQYDPVDWSLNCATLSQYYITQDNYHMARHCLEAQEKDIHEPVNEDDGEFERQRKEKIPRTKADIARCWANFCLNLIKEGKEKRENEERQAESEQEIEDPINNVTQNEQETENKNPLRFKTLETTLYEQAVPDKIIKDFDEARCIFREAQKWLNQAKEYYILDGHVSDYVQIQQDSSQLFKYVAFFEQDKERKCKMHKRRVDILSEVLCELNPQHYLQICRQMMFESAEAYSEMVDLKIAIINEHNNTPPSSHAIKKVNHLINQSIKFFQTFVDSMKQKGSLPETFDDDIVRPALVSHFCMARLYSKYIVSETKIRLENLRKSVDLYNYIISYCDSHPDMPKDAFEDELQISRDMATLLPIKMSKIMAASQ